MEQQPQNQCDHKFSHLETKKNHSYDGMFNTRFTRIDIFFCDKCLEQKIVKKKSIPENRQSGIN
jgi:hypothetical protein